MQETRFHEYSLSRFMLGTVQFGASYGIANQSGRPSFGTVLKIMECAAAGGVNCLDTAPAYGESEKIIGRAVRELGLGDKMTVVTKTPHLDDNLAPAEAEKLLRRGVESSLKNLQLDRLPVCLFHKESNAVHVESLLRMKAEGLIGHVGVSVNSPEWALKAIRSGNFEAVQLPTSILDQRYYRAGVFREAERAGVALFVRSVYLQGLLFLPEAGMPGGLQGVLTARRRLEKIVGQAGLGLAELAVRFVMSIGGVCSLVMGLETEEQLRENLRLFEQGPLELELAREVLESVPHLPDSILVPSLWPKRAR